MVGVGTILKGRYKLLEVLGQGSYGVVYKSQVLQTGQLVAIKVLKSELTSEPKKVERFRREAQSVRGLPSEAIVRVLDSDEQEGNFFNVYELVEGTTLRQVLDRSRVLPIDQALGMIIQVLRGLDVAHQAGVIHRDLKPANIMITKNGQPKIMDFGIAKDLNKASLTTEAYDQALGTPNYISPEQAQGSMEVDYRSDIYSVGVMLFEMLAGRPPFVADSTLSLLLKHINENPPLLYSLNSSIPPQLDGIIRTAMAKKPDSRYQSADQFANVLTHFMNNLTNPNNFSPMATPLGGWANWGGGAGTPTRFVPPPAPNPADKSNLPPPLPSSGTPQNQQIVDMPTQPINLNNRPLPGTAPLPNNQPGRPLGVPPPDNRQNTPPPPNQPPFNPSGTGPNQPPNQRPPGAPPLNYVPMGSGPNQQPYNPQGSGPNLLPNQPGRPQGGPPPGYSGPPPGYNPSTSGQYPPANQGQPTGPNFGPPPVMPPTKPNERKKVPWILIGGILAAVIVIGAIVGLFLIATGNNNTNTSGQNSPAATVAATTIAVSSVTVATTTTTVATTPSPAASPSPSPSPTVGATATAATTTNPNEAAFQQATKLVDAKDWKNAIAALEGLQGKGYNEDQVQKLLTQSYCSYGLDLVNTGDPADTFLTLQKCVSLDTNNADAKGAFDTISQYRDGVIFADQKNWGAAIPILEKLYAAKPDFRDVQPRLYDAYLQVISDYRRDKRYSDSLATCNKAKLADKGTGPVAASSLCADIQREINALTPVATSVPTPTLRPATPTPTPRSCFSNFFAYNNSSPGAIPAGPDQGSSAVVGVVLNRQKAPVSGATVRVSTPGFSFTAQTGGNGRFSIGGLGKGRWDVVVIAAPGYQICSSFSAAANLSGQSGSTVEVDFVESEP